jgi:hypothetical protein
MLQMPSGKLYRVPVVRTDVSENISLPSSGFFRVIGFHNCVSVEFLLIGLSTEEYYLCKIWGFHGGDWRMVSSGLLRRVAIVRTDVSEEPDASFIRVTKIGELGTTQAATSNRRTLRRNTKYFRSGSSETSVLTRATRRNNPEDTILNTI